MTSMYYVSNCEHVLSGRAILFPVLPSPPPPTTSTYTPPCLTSRVRAVVVLWQRPAWGKICTVVLTLIRNCCRFLPFSPCLSLYPSPSLFRCRAEEVSKSAASDMFIAIFCGPWLKRGTHKYCAKQATKVQAPWWTVTGNQANRVQPWVTGC